MDWKKVGRYSLYVLPGYGAYKEWKKPKDKRSILGVIGFSLYALPLALKIATLPIYVGAGIKTGEWKIRNHFKNIVENIQEKRENKLEKTIEYEEAVKPFKN